MATVIIKDFNSDNQASVNSFHELLVAASITETVVVVVEGWSNFAQSTPKQVLVADTSTQLLAANPSRLFARIVNNSAQSVYIQYGIDAVWQMGFPLRPGGIYVVDATELFLGVINAITQTGSVNIDVIEGIL